MAQQTETALSSMITGFCHSMYVQGHMMEVA
jgi:hypothetical protein